jgi:hypothetical protein
MKFSGVLTDVNSTALDGDPEHAIKPGWALLSDARFHYQPGIGLSAQWGRKGAEEYQSYQARVHAAVGAENTEHVVFGPAK